MADLTIQTGGGSGFQRPFIGPAPGRTVGGATTITTGGGTTIVQNDKKLGPPSQTDVVFLNQDLAAATGQLPPWQGPGGQLGAAPGQQDPKNDRLSKLEDKLDQLTMQNQQGNKGTDMKELMMVMAMMKQDKG
ncbi:MAG TPA: hypothetical protein V6C52_01735 [Coleofasciculaceae cyanobacterium]